MPDLADAIEANDSGALFSPCRRWRYLLWRRWDAGRGICAFIGLNPSTADETVDDPTIRRCMRFAKDWGYGSLWMLNAYAFRATDPRVMQAQGANALGPQNNEYIAAVADWSDMMVAAWGAHCDIVREGEIGQILGARGKRLYVLGFTKQGRPRHPLYIRADTMPVQWLLPEMSQRVTHA